MRTRTSEKIDLLMRITGTNNAQLARALNFDASYISRIRSGKRGLPSGLPFIEPAAELFARNIREPYQAETLARELGIADSWPASTKEAARLIASWLKDEDVGKDTAALKERASHNQAQPITTSATAEVRMFSGNQQRREAALLFLNKVLATAEPCELLLQSEEETAWMYEDPVFEAEWARLMTSLLKRGYSLTIVHTVSRDGTEMWEGIREWLPLYLAGIVKSYYYPRLRDGVRMRSLFVARNTCATVSNSVQGMEDDACCFMLDNPGAVAAYEREFDAFLSLCRPLAKVLVPASHDELNGLLADYGRADNAIGAEISGALACVRIGAEALFVTPGERPVVYRVTESRLVAAASSYLEMLPKKATNAAELSALLRARGYDCPPD